MIDNNEDGYVYVARLEIPGHPVYKIGHCSLSKSRLAEYTLLPYKVTYVGIWRTSERKNIEWELHEKFKSKRTKGEWFDLCEDDLNTIKEYFGKKNIKDTTSPIVEEEEEKDDGYLRLYEIWYNDYRWDLIKIHRVYFDDDGNICFVDKRCRPMTQKEYEYSHGEHNKLFRTFDETEAFECVKKSYQMTICSLSERIELAKKWFKNYTENLEITEADYADFLNPNASWRYDKYFNRKEHLKENKPLSA